MGAGVGGGGPSLPEQKPDEGQAAPAGLVFTDSELPVVAVHGGPPATVGGYSPDPNPTPQVSSAEDPMGTYYLKAPTGLQR